MKIKKKEVYRTIFFVFLFDILCLLTFNILKPASKFSELTTMYEIRLYLREFSILFDAFLFGLMGLIIYFVQETISVFLSNVFKGFKLLIKGLQSHNWSLLAILIILACFYIFFFSTLREISSKAEKFVSLYGIEGWMITALILVIDGIALSITELVNKFY